MRDRFLIFCTIVVLFLGCLPVSSFAEQQYPAINVGDRKNIPMDGKYHYYSFVPEVYGTCCFYPSTNNIFIAICDQNMNVLREDSVVPIRYYVIKGNQYYVRVVSYDSGPFTPPEVYLSGVTSWSFRNNILTVSGQGEMESCYTNGNVPWPKTMTKAVINPGVTTIGNDAFTESNLESISIPYGLKYVGSRAFKQCTNLQELSLPSTLEAIYSYAFSDSSITDIYYIGSQEEWNAINFTFGNDEYLRFIKKHFKDYSIIDINIPESTTIIETEAFRNIQDNVVIYIPPTVTSIADDAFSDIINVTISGESPSVAETFANDHGYRFVTKQ